MVQGLSLLPELLSQLFLHPLVPLAEFKFLIPLEDIEFFISKMDFLPLLIEALFKCFELLLLCFDLLRLLFDEISLIEEEVVAFLLFLLQLGYFGVELGSLLTFGGELSCELDCFCFLVLELLLEREGFLLNVFQILSAY
jgi:hypothetical protein